MPGRAGCRAEKANLEVKGVMEDMSVFAGDGGKRDESFGAGGGEELAQRIDVPLLGKVPLVPSLREGSDTGRPIVVDEPESDAAAAFDEISRAIVEDLAPTRRHHPELKIL